MPKLSEIFGQEAAVSALRRALSHQSLAGTYLLVGPAGSGKTALALALAQAAACFAPVPDPFDACGVCESCRRFALGTQPEVVRIVPAGDSTQIWQFWTRDNKPPAPLSLTLSYAPLLGKRRIYLIERADTLTESAANSLLKVLEEPPPYALFILLATHPARVLPTIVSRSQILLVRVSPRNELAQFLQRTRQIAPAEASRIADYSGGLIGEAISLAENAGMRDEITSILDFAELIPAAPKVRALKLAEGLRKLAAQTKALAGLEQKTAGEGSAEDAADAKERAGRGQMTSVFRILILFYRDLLTLSASERPAEARIIHGDRRAAFLRLAQKGDPQRWMDCVDAFLLAWRRLEANANVNLVTENLMMALVEEAGK